MQYYATNVNSTVLFKHWMPNYQRFTDHQRVGICWLAIQQDIGTWMDGKKGN